MGQAHDGTDAAPTVDSFGGEIGKGQARTIRARWELQSVTRVREAVALDLVARGVSDEITSEAELVVTELVTNSLRHASPLADRTVRIGLALSPISSAFLNRPTCTSTVRAST